MSMKKWLAGIVVLMAVAAVTSCVAIDAYSPKQRTQIESYLYEKEYWITSDSAYVHLAGNKFLSQRPANMQGAEEGDRVTFNFEAYTFSSSPANQPFYTNKPWVLPMLSDELDTSYWSMEPVKVDLGRHSILNSLEESLYGSVAGDSLLVFLPSGLAFGEAGMEAVPKNTAVMYILTVESVANKIK